MANIELNCTGCGKLFYRSFSLHNQNIMRGKKPYCSSRCSFEKHRTRKLVTCKQCEKEFTKELSRIKKFPNHFCSSSCSATYNNTHKSQGNRRSKLEIWLEEQLPNLFPDLDFKFNSKEEINSELDIYIPSLKLAFELNGIFHYEPIYGQERLAFIQNNDDRKFQACGEAGIALCIIDNSSMKNFKEKTAQKFLDIIVDVIKKSQIVGEGIEPSRASQPEKF